MYSSRELIRSLWRGGAAVGAAGADNVPFTPSEATSSLPRKPELFCRAFRARIVSRRRRRGSVQARCMVAMAPSMPASYSARKERGRRERGREGERKESMSDYARIRTHPLPTQRCEDWVNTHVSSCAIPPLSRPTPPLFLPPSHGILFLFPSLPLSSFPSSSLLSLFFLSSYQDLYRATLALQSAQQRPRPGCTCRTALPRAAAARHAGGARRLKQPNPSQLEPEQEVG